MTDFSELSECFSGELTISTIAARYLAAKTLLAQEKPDSIDISGVKKIDVSGIQFIIATEKHFERSEIKTRLINKNQYTTDSMHECGIVA